MGIWAKWVRYGRREGKADGMDNPYLQSRALWQDVYGNAEDRYRRSRRLNFLLVATLALCVAGLVSVGRGARYVPWIVQVQDGQVIHSGVVAGDRLAMMKPALARYFIQEFVISARSVSVDGYIARDIRKKAFALTRSAATAELAAFFDRRDPYRVVRRRTISVGINYVNRLPGHAFRVGWTETSRASRSGEMLYRRRFVGEFRVGWGRPSRDGFILRNNPFGFYVTSVSWTEVKQ